MGRPADPRFSSGERLYRNISADQVKNNRVKPTALRLQVSVSRSRFIDAKDCPSTAPPKFNGVAEISVPDARKICHGKIRAVCIDEPSRSNEAHALIAMVTDEQPDCEEVINDIDQVRIALANRLAIIIPPK